jgi:prepilin-type N-terminal cleavage/methylation domain
MNLTFRRGLSLVEVLVAMLVFAVGALGLAASSASLARQMSWNADRFRASALAMTRTEQIAASPCAVASGSDRFGTVTSAWSVGAVGRHITIDQQIMRRDSRGLHLDLMLGGAQCR